MLKDRENILNALPHQSDRMQMSLSWTTARNSDVDRFANDVGVACMSIDLGSHVDQGPVQGDLSVALGPPRHLASGIQCERVDGGIGMGPGFATEIDDAA